MKIVMQLIDTRDGTRSDPMAGERHEMAERLSTGLTQEQKGDLAVLVLLEHLGEPEVSGQEWKYSKAPFMKAALFIEHFAATLEN